MGSRISERKEHTGEGIRVWYRI